MAKKSVIKSSKPVYSPLASNSIDYTNVKIESDLNVLSHLAEAFSEVEGQDYACQAIMEYLFGRDNRRNEKGPSGIIVLAGPPAVGKTLISEQIAKALKLPFIRLDMSAYDKYSRSFLFGINKTFKEADEGVFTGWIRRNPRSVILLDEFEKASEDLSPNFLQVLERGSVKDLFTGEEVSVRDTIIIITTNVGRDIYNKDLTTYNFSRTSQSVVINALKTERNPKTGNPYFSEALVSRFSSGKIIMMNKLRPEVIHKIAVNTIKKQVEYYEELYKVSFDIEADNIAKHIIFQQGEDADIRTIAKAVKEFFEKNFVRIATTVQAANSKFDKISCAINYDNTTEEAKTVLFNSNKSRVLVYCSNKREEYFCNLQNADNVEFIFAKSDFEFNTVSNSDLAAAIIDIGAHDEIFTRKLFLALTEQETIPIYVYSESTEEKSAFNFYTDNGATDCYSPKMKMQTFLEWIGRIVKGIDLGYITQMLYRANKYIDFETTYKCNNGTNTVLLQLTNIDIKTAIYGSDASEFTDKRAIPDVKFEDIMGMDAAKKSIMPIINILKNYKKYQRLGIRIPRGIILDGDPGTGKTMFAKALANEANLPIIQKNASEFLNKWVGEGARALGDAFSTARKYAPSILFIDEIDAIARSRFEENHHHAQDVINRFLSEMDGFAENSSAPVFVIAATNFSTRKGDTQLDEAFLRRFDEKIHLDLPNMEQRKLFINKLLNQLDIITITDQQVTSIAKRSVGWNLADLKLVIQNAIRQIGDINSGLTLSDAQLNEAFESFTDGKAKRYDEYTLKKTAYHEAGHAIVASLLGIKPSYTTITARGGFGGYMYYTNEDITEYTKTDLENRICIAMAGRASEVVFYGEEGITSGASSDLKSATQTASTMLCCYGMDEEAFMYWEKSQIEKNPMLMSKIQTIIKSQYEKATKLISAHKETINRVVMALMFKNSLDEYELEQIINQNE